ncbi:MAG: peptide chain release factor family protein [Collinsella sp.]
MNTTDSAVRMRHVPSGIVVTARESRSQFQNRASCLRKLKEELARRARPSKNAWRRSPARRSRPGDSPISAIGHGSRRRAGAYDGGE